MGKVPARKNRVLNHPSGEPMVGKRCVCTLEMMEPKPWETSMVPRVAIKGGSFSFATIKPLPTPKSRPTSGMSSSAAHRGQPHME